MVEKRESAREPEDKIAGLLEDYGRFMRQTIAKLCPKDLGIQFDDIEQEARFRLWRAFQSEREIRNVASYMYSIAASVTIDAVRRVKARREQQLRLAEEETDKEDKRIALWAIARDDSPERTVGNRQILKKVETELNELSRNRRRAVGLHLQGFSTEEIGDLLGWSEPKARNLVYRGMEDLRCRLRRKGFFFG